ncbi:MAG: universal stress protein [Thermodesulfobacteriota bacterium]|nr:universal stress protein [Thermodesulfobacteriota bacterium]
MTSERRVFNKNILIAVDHSDNAKRAVDYVGQILGGVKGFKVTVLHVLQEAEEDYFPNTAEKDEWLSQYRKKVNTLLDDCREILIQAGFDPKDVSVRSPIRYCPSMAECILSERDEIEYDTIVVGRQGLSRSEEFLFGSVSSKIVTHARNCTVWVVE